MNNQTTFWRGDLRRNPGKPSYHMAAKSCWMFGWATNCKVKAFQLWTRYNVWRKENILSSNLVENQIGKRYLFITFFCFWSIASSSRVSFICWMLSVNLSRSEVLMLLGSWFKRNASSLELRVWLSKSHANCWHWRLKSYVKRGVVNFFHRNKLVFTFS